MYQLNPQLATKADTIGAYISETGKYTGIFVRAEKLVSTNKGTHGIGFTFKSDDSRECRFDIWTQNSGGQNLSGMNQVNAIMACLSLREINDTPQNVKKWDNVTNQEAMMTAPCFADLMNKRIGLLLRSEEYEKMHDGQPTGETGWRMGLFAIFQAGTELMASEILARKTKPEQLGKVMQMLADKPMKKRSIAASGHNVGRPATMQDMDDDIPF